MAAAGEHVRPSGAVLKEDLFETPPEEVRVPLQRRLGELRHEKYPEFRNHVRATVNNILYHRGKVEPSVNAVDRGQPEHHDQRGHGRQEENGAGEQATSGYTMMEEFMAFMNKKGKGTGKGTGKGGGNGAGGKVGGKGESEGNRKCIICGSTAHLTRDCPKPEVSREDRPCWKCGKPGHVGANCPNSGQRPAGQQSRAAGMVEQATEQPLTFFMV